MGSNETPIYNTPGGERLEEPAGPPVQRVKPRVVQPAAGPRTPRVTLLHPNQTVIFIIIVIIAISLNLTNGPVFKEYLVYIIEPSI